MCLTSLRQTWHLRPSSNYHLQGIIACSFQGYTFLARRGKETWMSFSSTKTKVDGKLRLPQKASELAELFQSITTPQVKMPEEINAIIIDESVVVNMIKPATGTERHLQNIQDSPFYPTFTLSSLMQSALMLYGMNILKTVLRPLPEVN